MHQYLPFLPFIETFEYSVSPRYFQSNKFRCKKKFPARAYFSRAPAISRMMRGSTAVELLCLYCSNLALNSCRARREALTPQVQIDFFFLPLPPLPRDVPDCWKCKINGSARLSRPTSIRPIPFSRHARGKTRDSLCSADSFRRKLNFLAFPPRSSAAPPRVRRYAAEETKRYRR